MVFCDLTFSHSHAFRVCKRQTTPAQCPAAATRAVHAGAAAGVAELVPAGRRAGAGQAPRAAARAARAVRAAVPLWRRRARH
eukprot:7043901-Prymnesium_polylepis.2